MTTSGSESLWSNHFERLALGRGDPSIDGIYSLKEHPRPQNNEKQPVLVIDPVESQVKQAEQELKEEEVQYQERVKGVKYAIPPDSRKPPSKRHKSVAIAPPTNALD